MLPFPVWQCISVITDNAAPGFLERICRDISSENTVCVFISYRRRQGALVLNSSDNRSADDACKRLADRLEREEQILAFGTGCTSGDVRLASVSYEQSQNALDYLALRPAGKGISFDSVNQAGARSVRRPSGLDNLEVVFSAGHFEEGERLLMEYLDGACSGGFVRKSYLLYARDRLLSAVQKLRESQKLSFDEERLAQFQPEKPSSYEEFYGLVLTVCRELESLSASQEEQAVSDSSRQILRFLEEHLCDEMFSLSQLAAAFGLSESMMSRRVKQLTGQTFLAYVTQKRIDLACRLLATTDMSVLSVAKASGYENDITFRRLFKKYMRVTPGEYRSQFPS